MQELIKIQKADGTYHFEYYYDGTLCLVQDTTLVAPAGAITEADVDAVEIALKEILGIA